MKTEEDEAFDDIERRQGGGFKAKQAMAADKVGPFEKWWYYEGSCPPYTHHDCEEHTKRMCKIAWSNGAYVAEQPAQKPVAFDAFLESKDFYELMQAYRHIPIDAVKPFEAVKDALRAAHNIKEKNND